jgi:biotin carboxyl carrier protein
MENDVVSPADGQVVAVRVSKGSSVNAGDVLILIG